VHHHAVDKESANLLDGKTLGVRDVEAGDDEGDNTKSSIDEEHAPFAVAQAATTFFLQSIHMLFSATAAGGEKGEKAQLTSLARRVLRRVSAAQTKVGALIHSYTTSGDYIGEKIGSPGKAR